MKLIKLKNQSIKTFFCAGLLLFSMYSCTQEDDLVQSLETAELNASLINSSSLEFDSYAFQNSNDLISKPNKTNQGKPFQNDEGWARGTSIPVILPNFFLYQKDVYQTQNYYVKLMDGQLKGDFEVLDYDADKALFSHVKGKILNVIFEDDCKTVRFTGVITECDTDDSMIGKYALWTSVDNGIKKNDDQTTDIRYGMSVFAANYHATKGFPLSLFGSGVFQNTRGNVKVKPNKCQ